MTALTRTQKQWASDGHHLTTTPLGHTVFYQDLGNPRAKAADTLLLLHGFPESSYSWHKIIDAMLTHFDRVVLFDMIGYGQSDKPEINFNYTLIEQADIALQLCESLKIKGTHIISHDMGTSVLTELLARREAKLLPAWFSDGVQSATFTNGSLLLEFAKLRLMQKLLLSRLGKWTSRLSNYALFQRTVLSAHSANPTNGLSENDIQEMWANCQLQCGHHKNHLLIRYINDRRRYEQSRWIPALASADSSLPIHFC